MKLPISIVVYVFDRQTSVTTGSSKALNLILDCLIPVAGGTEPIKYAVDEQYRKHVMIIQSSLVIYRSGCTTSETHTRKLMFRLQDRQDLKIQHYVITPIVLRSFAHGQNRYGFQERLVERTMISLAVWFHGAITKFVISLLVPEALITAKSKKFCWR